MASPGAGPEDGPPLQDAALPEPEPEPEPALAEARRWIEQATGRGFGDKDFRSGLENGILLCELLNAIKPGLVKKINRLPTPIAGLDNIILFLRGCKELGLKESQLFDPGDLQDASNRVTVKNIDYSRKLKNVLVTIYWLGKAANSCTSYNGAALNLREFEGLLAQMRKETEDIESPKRSIRDSGYIDCWDSERSDSLSPPRHGRDDSFDSLDSFGSRSQQTPSPDVVLKGSSDGRGSDSESDLPHRKMPDVKKDDMSARRTSYGEPKSAVPFNQYLPNKSNQTAYIPAPLRKKKAEREEYRKSWSTATSPLGGERPFSKTHPETVEEQQNEASRRLEEEQVHGCMTARTNPNKTQVDLTQNKDHLIGQFPSGSAKETREFKGKDSEEIRKLRRLEQVGIKVMSAAQRYGSQKPTCEDSETTPDIILRKENPFMMQGKDSGSEDEMVCRLPDLEKDDFAARRARMNQPKLTVPFNQFLYGPYTNKDKGKLEGVKKSSQKEKQEYARGNQIHMTPARQIVTHKENLFLQCKDNESKEEEQVKMPDIQSDDLTKQKTQSNLSQQQESPMFMKASITQAGLETWDRLKMSGETSKEDLVCPPDPESSAKIAAETVVHDDFATCKARAYKKASSPKQRFVHFGPVTEIDQQKWEKLSIARAAASDETEEETGRESAKTEICTESSPSATVCNQKSIGHTAEVSRPQNDPSEVAKSGTDEYCSGTPSSVSAACVVPQKQTLCRLSERHESNEEELDGSLPETERDDMMVRRMGAFQRHSRPIRMYSPPTSVGHHSVQQQKEVAHKKDLKTLQKAESAQNCLSSSLPLNYTTEHCHGTLSPISMGCTVTREESHVKLKYHDPISGGTEHKVKFPDPEKDDMMARRTGAFLKHTGPSANQFLPVPFSKQQNSQGTTKETVKTEKKVKRFGPRTAVSDDAESMSMFDMRCEDEAVMQPHSKARHEKLQNVHNQLKEDETRWQDDLARWKSRRRSASQDLIKKEAERKKMEKLLSGDGAGERRKSIKTYREIVEEKERREKELHEAYKNARSHEEAENILQQYIERFTISEAVLEHLQMPKILERSHSVEPNSSSPPKDPNPLRYLRQQSLPAPKYTATIEATIVPTGEMEASISTGHMSPSKTVVSKPVPMLTPKPYSQPKNTQQVLKNFKVDGKVSMNGETYNGVEEEKEKEYTTVMFAPSPSKSLKCEGVAREDGHLVELKQDITSIELSLQRPSPHRAHKETTDSLIEETEPANQKCETDSRRPEIINLENTSPGSDYNQFKATVTCASPAMISVEFPPPTQSEDAASKDKDLKKPEREQQKEAEDLVTQEMGKPKTLIQEGSIIFPFLKKLPETSQATLQNSEQQESPTCASVPLKVRNSWRRSQFFSRSADSANGDKSNHFNFWSWDPEEERKRQERWQHEQERLLQERYQKEQDKLKEEWEKAQKEVEEEERRYYEEERKIIEDTVVPFTISSSCTEPLSTSSSITEGSGIMNVTELSNSQEEDKQKEVTRQKKTLWEQDDASSLKNKENDFWQEKKSINKVLAGHPETILQRESEQDHQVSMMECSSSSRLNLPLTHDVSWNQQLLTKQPPHISEEVKQKTPLDQCIGQQTNSTGDMRRTGCFENFRTEQLSPCSPTAQSQSPNKRSVSGKKLCSSCGLPLGKGAAMIIETLGLYFHIQCFRCGICKGQLGDAVSGTDVRIRNGLLNCNDCYIRSRTAGQPTTL